MSLRIVHAGISDQGRFRFRNEDFIVHVMPCEDEVLRAKGYLFAICDGVGGTGAGDVASKEAGAALVEHYYGSRQSPERALRKALERANLRVYDLQLAHARGRMQTTLSAIVLFGSQLFLAHVGDSRIYRFREAPPDIGHDDSRWDIAQLSTDHSEVAELVRMQIIAPDMMRKHPRRNIITRSLGNEPVVRGQFLTESLQVGDIFLLCSDGLWEPVGEDAMAQMIETYEPEEACSRLIALALELGVTDNVSVQIIKVTEVPSPSGSAASESVAGAAPAYVAFFERVRRLIGRK